MHSGMSASRIERFDCCGSSAMVMYSQSTGRHQVRASYCHDRWCTPCGRTKARLITRNLARLMRGKTCRFITLTMRHNDEPLGLQIDRLYTCFARLRERQIWKENVHGAAAFLEVKLSKNKRHWHVHLHVVADGGYIPQTRLSQEWHAVTGDSTIVDIRRCETDASLAHYVCKYVTKPCDREVYVRAERLQEVMVHTRGRHTCMATGAWYGHALEMEDDEVTDWTPIARLDTVWAAQQKGEIWATELWKILQQKRQQEEAAWPIPPTAGPPG